jgi:hypothetical protein
MNAVSRIVARQIGLTIVTHALYVLKAHQSSYAEDERI